MTRARRNAKRKHPTPAPAKPSASVSNTLLVRNAIDAAPPGPKPSIAQATAHPVDMERYSARERAQAQMAMDFNGTTRDSLTFVEATGFPGFPTLSLLGQLAEYRTMHETLADECVRMWGKVTSAGESDPSKLADIEAELRRIDLRALVRQAIVHDQAFGGAHVYFKLKGDEDFRDTPLVMGPYTVRQGSFEGLRVVEPYWVTPNFYNSIDPTAADFYKPSSWWMLGIQVHATRLQTIISRPVADMLKPAYSFRGVSMTQLAAPYVDNWLRTRQSVSDTVKQFSVSGIKTDLQQALAPGALMQLQQRAELINAYRDNRNLLFLDMATEEFFQVNTPLSGLDALQAQAQEQMAAVSHIPLVKLLGITPTGLNASSDGEIRVFYDYVRGYQSNVLHSLLQNVLRVVQLSLFGAIDPDVSWTWEPLEELSALEDADRRNKDATSDQVYMETGVVTPQQVAEKLAADPRSGYAGILDKTDAEPADDDIEAITQQILGIGAPVGAQDAEFSESDHPRAANGQFGSGGSSAGGTAPSGQKTKAVKLREGHQAVKNPVEVFKDAWGDYIAPGISGSLPKQHVTVKGGKLIGMHPTLAKNANVEVEGEVAPKSEKTTQKVAQAQAAKAQQESERQAAARSAVFQMSLGRRLAKIPAAEQATVERELGAIVSDPDSTPEQRVEKADAYLKARGV